MQTLLAEPGHDSYCKQMKEQMLPEPREFGGMAKNPGGEGLQGSPRQSLTHPTKHLMYLQLTCLRYLPAMRNVAGRQGMTEVPKQHY